MLVLGDLKSLAAEKHSGDYREPGDLRRYRALVDSNNSLSRRYLESSSCDVAYPLRSGPIRYSDR